MITYIGCSGYHYEDWKGKFYPPERTKANWFDYYAAHFNTVEINNTFYHTPDEEKLKKWRDASPAGFQWTIKANRFFTHLKKLKTDDHFMDNLNRFQQRLRIMGDSLGCVLWQLPGNLKANTEKLEAFCRQLDQSFRHVLEFRHESWWDDDILKILENHQVAFCMVSSPVSLPEQAIQTAGHAYIRFHGKADWYKHDYSERELDEWKDKLAALKDVNSLFAYFNNDQEAYAVKNALEFKRMLANEFKEADS